MSKKEKCIFVCCFVFSVFLFLCTMINFVGGHIGAAIGGFGAGIFYLSFAFVVYEKSQKDKENRNGSSPDGIMPESGI